MKKIQISFMSVAILIFSISVKAQYRNRMQGHRIENHNEHMTSKPKNQTQNMLLFVNYNSATIFKKIKLKDKVKIKSLGPVLEKYNNRITEIKAFESDSLNVAREYMIQKRKEAKQSGDSSIMQEAQVRIKEILKPLHIKLQAQQDLLNLNFKKTLTPKQYEKWLKYQKNKLEPKSLDQTDTQRQHHGRGQERTRY